MKIILETAALFIKINKFCFSIDECFYLSYQFLLGVIFNEMLHSYEKYKGMSHLIHIGKLWNCLQRS